MSEIKEAQIVGSIAGVDFGTSCLRVAVARDGEVTVLEHVGDRYQIPMLFQFGPEAAKGAEKRLAGMVSFKRALDFERSIVGSEQQTNSLDVLAHLFRDLWDECQKAVGGGLENCVIAVSPCSSERHRSAVRRAAQKAGIARVKLVEDTLAVMLANKEKLTGKNLVLAFTWGASAFSTSLFVRGVNGLRPVAQEGDFRLGGDDIDCEILMTMVGQIKQLQCLLPGSGRLSLTALSQLLEEARQAKPCLASGSDYITDLALVLGVPAASRPTFLVSHSLYEQTMSKMAATVMGLVSKVLGGTNAQSPEAVLLSGGMTRTPEIQKELREKVCTELLETHATDVAVGAALYGQALPQGEWQMPVNPEPQRSSVGKAECDEINGRSDKNEFAFAAQHHSSGRWADTFIPLFNEAERNYEDNLIQKSVEKLDALFVELARFSGEVYRRAAFSYIERGDVPMGHDILRKAYQRDRSNAWIARIFAEVCYKMCTEARAGQEARKCIGVIGEGIEAIEPFVQTEKGYASLQARLLHLQACFLSNAGNNEEAETALSRCVKLEPSCEQYKEDLNKLRPSTHFVNVPKSMLRKINRQKHRRDSMRRK